MGFFILYSCGIKQIGVIMKNKEINQNNDLRQHYLNILTKQLKDICYRKWKYEDMCLSFMSLKDSL